MRNKFQPKPASTMPSQVDMPSKQDRLILYSRIKRIVSRRCEEYGRLLDTRRQFFFSSQHNNHVVLRKRQVSFLRMEFLPTVSAALLLELQDLEEEYDEEDDHDDNDYELQQPIECIALLICNMVLLCKGNYDARIRSIVKQVCVDILLLESPTTMEGMGNPECNKSRALIFLTQDNKDDEDDEIGQEFLQTTQISYTPKLTDIQQATIQFESIERAVATDILKVLVERDAEEAKKKRESEDDETRDKKKFKDAVVKGLQITTVGVFVGSIFAVTGGLAAPGLVAAITALGIHGGSVAFATLTTTTALASMFGAVGGGMGAYKMSKRVKGLSEWKIRKETVSSEKDKDSVMLRGLHAHVCVSGWLSDASDFQRPFGVQANDPKMPRLEALQRLFCVHDPEKVRQAEDLLKANKGEEDELWYALAGRYGRDPDHVLPLDRSYEAPILPRDVESALYGLLNKHVLDDEAAKRMKDIFEANTMLVQMEAKNMEVLAQQMTSTSLEEEKPATSPVTFSGSVSTDSEEEQEEEEDDLLDANDGNEDESLEIVANTASLPADGDFSTLCENKTDSSETEEPNYSAESIEGGAAEDCDQPIPDSPDAKIEGTTNDAESRSNTNVEGNDDSSQETDDDDDTVDYSHVVWDWEATYAGEMYTVTWETDFLLKLCKVANVLFQEISHQVSKQIVTQSLLGAAVAVPSALMTCAEVIDDPYQIIASRSEKAGVELAHCLLEAQEHRPISLVGYSFGARVVFSCLLELARHQEIWQEQQLNAAGDEPRDAMKKKRKRRKKKADDIEYVREPASIVEDVILIGMPRLIETKEWVSCRELVGGRLVNCFNRKDWIVSYMINIRCWNGIRKTCGAYAIENVEGVENYEVSLFASTHGRYQVAVPQILHMVGYSQPRNHRG